LCDRHFGASPAQVAKTAHVPRAKPNLDSDGLIPALAVT
jgi:hypothetical protein